MKRIFSLFLVVIMITILTAPGLAQAATVKISKAKATMEVDSTLKLKITGTDSKVTWSTSKKTIATVSTSGTVTAIKEGQATITATVNSKKYTCKVTVIDSNKVTPTPTPSLEPEYLKQSEIPYLYTNVKKYIGKYVEISGKVLSNPEKFENGIAFQMFQDPVNNGNNTIVYFYGKKDIKEGDYVIIDGQIFDEFQGQNAFGGLITAPIIIANSVTISTYKDVIVPTEKIMEIRQIQEQFGYEIVLEKVEFAKTETRVYLTINNNGSSNFSAYSFNMKLIQNKKQYTEQDNWSANYPKIQTDLYPDTTSSGIVCFPAISQTDDFVLYIDGSSGNWEEDIKEYKFAVKVK